MGDKVKMDIILKELNDIFYELTGDKTIELTIRSRLNASVGLTSLGFVQYICMIEEYYSIDVPNVDLHKIKKVKDLVKYIEKKKG